MNNPKKKLPLLIFLLVGLAVLAGAGGYFLKNIGPKPQIQPKLIKQTSLSRIAAETHPNLYISKLEYNQKQGVTTQLSVSKNNGDMPHFLSSPSTSPRDFSYKIDVIAADGKVLQSGWDSIDKEIAIQTDDKIRFRIATLYQKDALVRVSLPPENIIWTGKQP